MKQIISHSNIYIVVCVCLYWNVQDMINLNTKEVLCSHITLPLWPNISDVLFEISRIKHLTLSINLSKQVKYFYCPNVSFYVTKGVHLIGLRVFPLNFRKCMNLTTMCVSYDWIKWKLYNPIIIFHNGIDRIVYTLHNSIRSLLEFTGDGNLLSSCHNITTQLVGKNSLFKCPWGDIILLFNN